MAKKVSDGTPRYMCKATSLEMPHDVGVLAQRAIEINPYNAPILSSVIDNEPPSTPLRIALTTKWWGSDKKKFTFSFMSTVKKAAADKIQNFANRWKTSPCAIEFAWTNDVNAADFRLAFEADGYWSYIGTDCSSIAKNQHTMNLQGMGVSTFSDSEGLRVIPHEFGHALGMPHEHSRPEIVALLDPTKTIKVFKRDQGWSEADIRAQVLTPIPQSSLHAFTAPDQTSIMCYWFTGECTKDGKPIVGGFDLSTLDKQLAAKMWPTGTDPTTPPTPPTSDGSIITWIDNKKYRVVAVEG